MTDFCGLIDQTLLFLLYKKKLNIVDFFGHLEQVEWPLPKPKIVLGSPSKYIIQLIYFMKENSILIKIRYIVPVIQNFHAIITFGIRFEFYDPEKP